MGNNKETQLQADQDVERAQEKQKKAAEAVIDWDKDPNNPLNWPAGRKALQVMMLSSAGLLAYVATSLPFSNTTDNSK